MSIRSQCRNTIKGIGLEQEEGGVDSRSLEKRSSYSRFLIFFSCSSIAFGLQKNASRNKPVSDIHTLILFDQGRTCLRPAKVHFPVPSWPNPKMEMMEDAGLISCEKLTIGGISLEDLEGEITFKTGGRGSTGSSTTGTPRPRM